MINKIYIDLDGVIRAWDEAVIELYKLPITRNDIYEWGSVFTEYRRTWGIDLTEKQFWDNMKQEFWTNLKFTDEAPFIIEMLDTIHKLGRADVVILTSPTLDNAGWSQEWIRKNMPTYFHSKRYIIGPDKKYLAYPDALLIDDAEKNILPWRERGGVGFLFPRPWNNGRLQKDEGVECLRRTLQLMNLF